SIRAGIGPFHNVSAGGTHVHHLVWGIALLIAVGYVWLLEVGVGSSWIASLTAILFGVGAALTLDEFALWLNLQDVYWDRQGRVHRQPGPGRRSGGRGRGAGGLHRFPPPALGQSAVRRRLALPGVGAHRAQPRAWQASPREARVRGGPRRGWPGAGPAAHRG